MVVELSTVTFTQSNVACAEEKNLFSFRRFLETFLLEYAIALLAIFASFNTFILLVSFLVEQSRSQCSELYTSKTF